MSNNNMSKNKRKKQARKQAQQAIQKQAIPQVKPLTKPSNVKTNEKDKQPKQAKNIEKVSEENRQRQKRPSQAGKNRRKKEMKKQAITQIKQNRPVNTKTRYYDPKDVHIFLVNRTSYLNLFNSSDKGGRCLYEISDAENSEYLSIISIYEKLVSIGATNFVLFPRLEYALEGVGFVKVEKKEDLESRLKFIEDDRNVYSRLEFQMEGCSGYVNTRFYKKNMVLESRGNDNYKKTKLRY